jgi:YcxB-like protein
MEISFTFRFSDYRALAKAMRTPGRRLAGNLLFWFIFGLNIAILIVSLCFAEEFGLKPRTAPIAAGLAMGLLLLRFTVEPAVLRYNYKRLGLDGKRITVRLEDDVFTASEQSAESRIKWSAIIRYSQLPTHAFLWINKLQAVLVPFDAFTDEASRSTFLSYIESKVPTGI